MELLISLTILVIIGLLAIYCKKALQKIQTILVLILTLGMLIIAVSLLPNVRLSALFSSFDTQNASPLMSITTIIILAPWTFVGFEVISLETAHSSFPVRKAGKLITVAILLGTGIYITLALSATAAQPDNLGSWQDYMSRLDRYEGIASIPTFFASQTILGKAGIWVIGITAASAVLSSVIGLYRASARILMNMAEDRILTQKFRSSSFCFFFLMILSMIVCLFGRTALTWFVDLSSFGAIIGFGYASLAVHQLSQTHSKTSEKISSTPGIIISVCFCIAQLVPGISLIQTMKAESYLVLALWCLLGFAFYWRTMQQETLDHGGNENTTIAALFLLLIFSALIWYVKRIRSVVDIQSACGFLVSQSILLMLLVSLGLIVMLLIHAQLRKRQMRLETERIRTLENSQAKSTFLFNVSHDLRTP